MAEEPYHIPALLPQAIDALNIRPDGTYIDVTYGGGGHSRAIVERLDTRGHLYGFDQDIDAVRGAMSDVRFTMVYSNFRFIENFMRYYGVSEADGILADLGVSFHHFDTAERGFTFRDADSPLDMRMNTCSHTNAADLLNTAGEERIDEIFRLYGEVQGSRNLARAIVKARAVKPLVTAGDLLAIVEPMINPARRKKELAKIFQALRIVVNDEIGALRRLLESSLRILRPGGRLAIITYHSLEDRLVKNFMRTGNLEGRVEKDIFGRSDLPLKMKGNKPVVPDEAEIEANPRSRSAKLRVAEKI